MATSGVPVQPSTSAEPVVSRLYGRHLSGQLDGSVFAERSTGKPVARSEAQNRATHKFLTLNFAKRPSTGILTLSRKKVHLQNRMVDPGWRILGIRFGGVEGGLVKFWQIAIVRTMFERRQLALPASEPLKVTKVKGDTVQNALQLDEYFRTTSRRSSWSLRKSTRS